MDYQYRTKPYPHQDRIFKDTRDLEAYALFWEQGTGKSKPTIDTLAYQYLQGAVNALLVVAPNGVHANWVTDELPTHLPERILRGALMHYWRPSATQTKWHETAVELLNKHPGLSVFCVPAESFITDRCKKAVWRFLKLRKVFYVLDEGITIKSPGAKRTMSIVASGKHAVFRRLLNGTPIAKEPWDVYSQMKFLDEDFWKKHELDGIQTMRSHFGIWQKIEAKGDRPEFDLCTGYRRLGELQAILKTASDRVLKEDVLDLPPKIYSKARFEMSKEQAKHYESLKDEYLTWLNTVGVCPQCQGRGEQSVLCGGADDQEEYILKCEPCEGTGNEKGGLVTADLAITRMLRLQQVTSGYLPTELGNEEPFHMMKENPRLERFMAGARVLPHGCIVWARFTKDVDIIMEALQAAKLTAVRYDGKVKDADRTAAKVAFQKGEAQFFVANPAALSMGVTLLTGKTVVYYSNNFNLVQRLQSEDRPHRIGQDVSVNIVDMIADKTIDELIVKSHRDKLELSSQVTGDRVKDWL